MDNNSSYNIEDFAVDIEQEIHRLNAQVDLFWEKECPVYRALGMTDGMAVLDCGCGPAHLVERLNEEFPTSKFTGIELSETLCNVANVQIKTKNLSRCSVLQRSITDLKLPDESFDFVISRLVIEHLPDPLLALREVYRVLKIGGRAVFVDNDFDFHVRTNPNVPELADLYNAYCDARVRDGGNPRIGRQLPNLLMQAGYSNVSLEMVCAQNRIIGDEAFSKSEGSGIALQLVKEGFLKSETYDRLAVNWGKMLKDPDHAIVRMLFLGSGVKQRETENFAASVPHAKATGSAAIKAPVVPREHHTPCKSTILSECMEIVAEAYELPCGQIKPEHSLNSLGVSSLAGLSIAMSVKDKWSIDYPVSKVFSFGSIQEMADEIQRIFSMNGAGGDTDRSIITSDVSEEGVV